MGDRSMIEWTDATWNPLRGCSRTSPGCEACYAEGVAARFSGEGQPYAGLIHRTTKGWNGTVKFVPEVLDQPLRWRRPRRIFVNSMSDLFHEKVPFEWIDAIMAVMARAQHHVFQVLTKRPERMVAYFEHLEAAAASWQPRTATGHFTARDVLNIRHMHRHNGMASPLPEVWPLPNVWFGVSVENQSTADERIPLLLKTPAAVRWLSCEPLIGPVSLRWTPYAHQADGQSYRGYLNEHGKINEYEALRCLDWVVVGGESGSRARPMHPSWPSALRDQCEAAGVPFFFKQWGQWELASHDNGHSGFVMPMSSDKYTWVGADGRTSNPSHFGLDDPYAMAKVGKKASGRLLDGKLHDGYPTPVEKTDLAE